MQKQVVRSYSPCNFLPPSRPTTAPKPIFAISKKPIMTFSNSGGGCFPATSDSPRQRIMKTPVPIAAVMKTSLNWGFIGGCAARVARDWSASASFPSGVSGQTYFPSLIDQIDFRVGCSKHSAAIFAISAIIGFRGDLLADLRRASENYTSKSEDCDKRDAGDAEDSLLQVKLLGALASGRSVGANISGLRWSHAALGTLRRACRSFSRTL